MKETPILFIAPMVRAILDGRKTQTRRIMKPQPQFLTGRGNRIYANCDFKKSWEDIPGTGEGSGLQDCPFGAVSDRLWVRETWRPKTHNFPTGWKYEYRATAEQDLTPTDGSWKPSIFMPRDACRIRLEITDIRVERLNDISEADAISEGIESFRPVPGDGFPETLYKRYSNVGGRPGDWITHPELSFRSLWEKINGPVSWAQNPYVWVVKFKVV